jgi:hypothetical protein
LLHPAQFSRSVVFFFSEFLPCDKNIIQWNLSTTEPGHTGKLSLAENSYSTENSHCTCMKRKLPASRKQNHFLAVPL